MQRALSLRDLNVRFEEINKDLQSAAFEFFYWFSRFEFVLKESGHLKSKKTGDKAEPCWKNFREKYAEYYSPCKSAQELIRLHPKRQIIGEHGGLEWKLVGLNHCKDDLCKVITLLCAIRNNLFHRGKHGDIEMDNQDRSLQLLTQGKLVLDNLAEMTGFNDDYQRFY